MIFLLPPSESKRVGGQDISITQVALTFSKLQDAREKVLSQLLKACKSPKRAKELLKLSAKQAGLVQTNLQIREAKTMPALQRYTGTLYDAIGYETLSAQAIDRARETVLIQSALFGLICSSDLIPEYRFSASTKLPAIKLAELWSKAHEAVFERLAPTAPIIDLRSKSYEQLAPIPNHVESYWVEVVSRDSDGKERAMNHFNKKSKGLLIRAILDAKKPPQNLADLKAIANSIDMGLEVAGSQLRLIVSQVV